MSRPRVVPLPDRPRSGALDVDTEVPTPSGLITLDQLEVGDAVFGADGKPVVVTELSAPLLEPVCLEVEFSTGDRVVADAEQRWLTERRDLPRSALVPTRRATLEVAGSVAELGPHLLGVRVAPPVRLPERRLSIDPYLLGVWLAVGGESAPVLHGASDALLLGLQESGARVFASALPGQHWVGVPLGTARRPVDLTERFRALGVLGNKHVPMTYLRASEAQRRDLLAGLLDAAGEVADGGEVVLRTEHRAVAAGAYELLASLGLRPRIRPAHGDRVDVAFMTTEQVFRLDGLHEQHQLRRRLGTDLRLRRLVVGVRRVSPRPVRRLRVAADDGVLLVGRSFIPMPCATIVPVARISSPA